MIYQFIESDPLVDEGYSRLYVTVCVVGSGGIMLELTCKLLYM